MVCHHIKASDSLCFCFGMQCISVFCVFSPIQPIQCMMSACWLRVVGYIITGGWLNVHTCLWDNLSAHNLRFRIHSLWTMYWSGIVNHRNIWTCSCEPIARLLLLAPLPGRIRHPDKRLDDLFRTQPIFQNVKTKSQRKVQLMSIAFQMCFYAILCELHLACFTFLFIAYNIAYIFHFHYGAIFVGIFLPQYGLFIRILFAYRWLCTVCLSVIIASLFCDGVYRPTSAENGTGFGKCFKHVVVNRCAIL